MRSRIATLLALLVVLGMASEVAAAPGVGFALVGRSARFSFFSRGERKVQAEKSEKFLADVEQQLGARFEGQAEYYVYGWPEELAAATGVQAGGVTFAATRQIHSTQAFHAHEIVHLVAAQLGDPGALFQEGLAVALGDGGKWQGRSLDKAARSARQQITLSGLLADFRSLDPQRAYPLAGSFVQYLIARHGLDAVSKFFRACGSKSANREVAFTSAFGQGLSQEANEWWARL